MHTTQRQDPITMPNPQYYVTEIHDPLPDIAGEITLGLNTASRGLSH